MRARCTQTPRDKSPRDGRYSVTKRPLFPSQCQSSYRAKASGSSPDPNPKGGGSTKIRRSWRIGSKTTRLSATKAPTFVQYICNRIRGTNLMRCRKLSGRRASYVCLGPPRVHSSTPGHVPSRAPSRHRLIALVGAAPSPPAHTPPWRRPPWLLLGSLRWAWGGCSSPLAVAR